MHCDIRSSSSQDRHSHPEGSFSVCTFLELWEETAGNPHRLMQACTEGQKRGDETFLIWGELSQHRTTQTPTQPSILLENVLHCWFFSILPGLGHSRVSLCHILLPSRPLLVPTVVGRMQSLTQTRGLKVTPAGGTCCCQPLRTILVRSLLLRWNSKQIRYLLREGWGNSHD